LETLKLIKKNLPVKTVLGASNVSFGLPNRRVLNQEFLELAKFAGLDAAIFDSAGTRKIQMINDKFQINSKFKFLTNNYALDVLLGLDPQARRFIDWSQGHQEKVISKKIKKQLAENFIKRYSTLKDEKAAAIFLAVLEGDKENIEKLLQDFLQNTRLTSLEINNQILIPALEIVGERFEKKEYFLPQVLMSAETMQKAFGVLEKKLVVQSANSSSKEKEAEKATIVFATVEGDIHDIGKNIAIAVLKNYGYKIIDLGKSVPTEKILEAVQEYNAEFTGLSALMTTTMPRMKEVIELFKKCGLKTKVIIGGAAVTPRYAKEIGADGYAKDAMEAVKVIGRLA
jgi:5-methyltetrahydrofolate--homocysteine methyltransferase